MVRHRTFSFDFKHQLVLDFLERREVLREPARKHMQTPKEHHHDGDLTKSKPKSRA